MRTRNPTQGETKELAAARRWHRRAASRSHRTTTPAHHHTSAQKERVRERRWACVRVRAPPEHRTTAPSRHRQRVCARARVLVCVRAHVSSLLTCPGPVWNFAATALPFLFFMPKVLSTFSLLLPPLSFPFPFAFGGIAARRLARGGGGEGPNKQAVRLNSGVPYRVQPAQHPQ